MAKILIVDDSTTMRKIVMKGVKAAAEAAGKKEPTFVEAGDGFEALEQLTKNLDVNAILCDVNMPNMDGIQFVRTLRDSSAIEKINVGDKSLLKRVSNKVPILMITTEGGLDKVQEALTAGANDYLKKPFTTEQLAEKCGSYFD